MKERLERATAMSAAPDLAEMLSADEEASFDESIAQEQRGEFVSQDVAQAFWASVGL